MQSQEKSTNQCMTAKLTGKPKVSEASSVSQPLLNRFDNISQWGNLCDMVTVFLDFIDHFYYQEPEKAISLPAREQQNELFP